MKRAIIVLAIGVLVVWAIVEAGEGRGPITTPELRHLRAMKDRVATPGRFEDLRLEDFATLPPHRPLATYAPIERRGVRVEGYIQHVSHSTDGDFHIMLVERAEPGARPRYLTTEITPAWSRSSRRWTVERLVDSLSADRAGVDGHTPRVRISGWLMYDWWADAVPGWVFDRSRRVSAWEIHPVTRIEVWDESRKAMVDFAR